MKSQEVYIALLDKCNKLNSNAESLLYPHVAVRAINEAMYYWYDNRLKKAELDLTIQREVSKFIIPKLLTSSEITTNYNAYLLPDDYYHYNQLRVVGIGKCRNQLDTLLVEHNNTSDYFLNGNFQPDLFFEQTFASIRGNSILVFKKDFELEVNLDYYRKLKEFDIKSNYKHLDGTDSEDKDLEFDNSDAYEIITIAAQIITGNLSDPQYQVHSNTTKLYE